MSYQHLVSVAPMLDCTDRHCRYLLRLISPSVLLYTEMITANAIIYGDRHKLLAYNSSEHPVAFQVGGSEPEKLAECAKIVAEYGYDEINLNVGCPSDRVQMGKFGACLMKEPVLVAECVQAMREAAKIPVTIKTRIGVDEFDSYDFLINFIQKIANTACDTFIMHARKAWLKGLSPRENREIPPLRYDVVKQLKIDFPNLTIVINGGIKDLATVKDLLQTFDGVMIGREIYQNPFLLIELEQQIYNTSHQVTRYDVLNNFMQYMHTQLLAGVKLSHMAKHLFGLFYGQYGGRLWRRFLSENIYRPDAGVEVVVSAMELLKEDALMSDPLAQLPRRGFPLSRE